MNGTVKWFDEKKGYGFLTGSDGVDVFVHHSAITGQKGRRNLTEGQPVEFKIEPGDRGPKAADVRAEPQPLTGGAAPCPSRPATHH